MKVLLTFTGFHDPYCAGLVGESQQPGPIVSLVSARQFDEVILFGTPATDHQTQQTEQALHDLQPGLKIRVENLPIQDPTDYLSILRNLRQSMKPILDQAADKEMFIAVASGTPQMHACWLLLVSGGEIPAKILHIRPPRYVTKDAPMVSVVNIESPEFPDVCYSVCEEPSALYGEGRHATLGDAIAELGIVGEDPKTVQALKMASVLAEHDQPILIQGETGTGKELIARLIHRLSGRSGDKFIAVNCGALPDNLVESILFGHIKGAFTGANANQLGKFEIADGGTLFLDEVGELPAEVQPKFLRVLEDGIVEPIGAKRGKKVDVRILAATNVDLQQAVEGKTFREDLYYRLSFATIKLPPLRERRGDIPGIALHILDKINKTVRRPKRLSADALTRLQGHAWKGNIRDLENVLGRSALMAQEDVLRAEDLLIDEPRKKKDPLSYLPEPGDGFNLEEYLRSVRKQLMLKALEMAGGRQSGAARMLGVSPQAVHKFLQPVK